MDCEFSEWSGEEEAKLQISNKRVKDSADESCSEGDNEATRKPYKDKLVGEVPGAYAQLCVLNNCIYEEAESDNEMEELAKGVAAVKLSKDTKVRIRNQWRNTLIVKVVGHAFGYHFLHRQLMSLWKPHGKVDCVDLGKDYFLFRFSF